MCRFELLVSSRRPRTDSQLSIKKKPGGNVRIYQKTSEIDEMRVCEVRSLLDYSNTFHSKTEFREKLKGEMKHRKL